MQKKYDIIVAGCGCAGFAAAVQAGRLGKNVLIIEKNGITEKELIKAVVKNSSSSAEDYYSILSECGMSDDEIVEIIKKYNGVIVFPKLL